MARKSGHTSAETKEVIKKAFMKIYEEKEIDRITVDELVKVAKVNRSTFYYYYQDVYDLARQVEDEFISTVEQAFPHIISGLINQNIETHLAVLIDFCRRNREQYLFFMVQKPNIRVITAIQNFAQEYALKFIGIKKEDLTLKQRLIVEYIAHAQLGLIGWWLANGQEYPLEQFSQLIMQINMQGPLSVLMKSIMESEELKDV